MTMVRYRRAGPEDYPAILRIQSTYYSGNLTAEERKEGFLSSEFTPEQVATMAEDLGTMVAIVENSVAGFLCACRKEFEHGSPVIEKMLESYDQIYFEGKSLSSYNSYIYGPVCIARDYRRRGLLRGLYEAQKRALAGQFDIGVAFVARNNPHSLGAHVAGLGMTEVGNFELRGNLYVILGFRLPPRSSQ